MKKKPGEEEDNVRIDPRLVRIGLKACEDVADSMALDFHGMSIADKKAFLTEAGAKIMEKAKQDGGELGRYFENRVVVLLENKGRAGLYFTKRK